MKAIVYKTYGGPEVLEITEIATPEPGANQILVRVFSCSINPLDWKIAGRKFWPILQAKFPQIPGSEIAGEVVKCGSAVKGFSMGNKIHGFLPKVGNASAEYAIVSPKMITKIPDKMDFDTAAGLPLSGLTALQALMVKGRMPLKNSNQRILIIGASGGVGHIALQIAKSAGATAIGVCSSKNASLVKELGCDQVLLYDVANPYQNLTPCDVILDCVGQPFKPWLAYLKPKGIFISIVPTLPLIINSLNPFATKKVTAFMLKPKLSELLILNNLFNAGKIKVICKSFALENMKSAWQESISGRAVGKLIINVKV